MRRIRAATVIASLSCAALGVATPLAHSSPAARSTLSKCWVGTWRDGHEVEHTTFDGKRILMHYSGGDVDHFYADGVDKDNWTPSAVQRGTYDGSTVTEKISGELTVQLHAVSKNRVRYASGHYSKSSTNTYTYKGRTYTGYLSALKPFTAKYTCTATTLKYYTNKGKLTGTETRISDKP